MNDESRLDSSEHEPTPAEIWKTIWIFIIEPKHSNAIIAVATLVTCLTTICYTVYSSLQWKASDRAASAASDSVIKASESTKLDERAWVSLFDIPPLVGQSDGFTVRLIFMNTGKTPAKNFVIKGTGEVLPRGGMPTLPESLLPGRGVIAPGGRFHTSLVAKGAMPKNVALTIHGKIEYESVFGHEHWATFCYRLAINGRQVGQGFAPCESGNDIDENPP